MKDQLIDELVKLEWQEFQQVNNEGGRASCQDNCESFSIFRNCQYSAWSEELLESYLEDLKSAKQFGWNLLSEKYARMMENTAPLEYEELKQNLPPISSEKKSLIEKIIQVQIKWEYELKEKYPHLSGQGRPIGPTEGQESITSFITYLKGELATYSIKTVKIYYNFIEQLANQGKNLSIEIMKNTVNAYGYESLDAAEKRYYNLNKQ